MYIIFGKNICSACQEAKRIFEGDGLDFRYIDLDNMTPGEKAIAAWYEALREDIALPYIVNPEMKKSDQRRIKGFDIHSGPSLK